MNKEQAIHNFWSSFTIPAFEENSVPDKQAFPYLTYESVTDDVYGGDIASSVSLWYRSSSWGAAIAKKDEIAEAITSGGKMIRYQDGAMWMRKGSPFARRMGDDSDNAIKRVILNIETNYISQN